MQVIDRAFVRGLMPARDQGGHKGTFGKVYLLGGSVGYTGAPVLCAGGAVHSGCGLAFFPYSLQTTKEQNGRTFRQELFRRLGLSRQ